LYEVLEFFRKVSRGLIFGMLSPEEISSVDSKAFVVDVVVCRLYERRVLGNHDEQDYRSGEDVYRLAIVFLS
jgi:hypothetical protein